MMLIFFVYPVYAILYWFCNAYAATGIIVMAAAAVAAAITVSIYAANNYYFCSLIILCDDSDSDADRICGCLENMGYFKTDQASPARFFRSKRFYCVRREVRVEINAGCVVLRGPKRSISRVAALFDNCYDWSDKH